MFLFIGLFIFILVIAIFLCANVLYDLALNPHFDKSRIFGSGEKPEEESWPANIFDGEAEAEDVWITSCDGLRLHGLCARQKTDSSASLQDSPCRQEERKRDWVIGIHGYTGDAAEMGFRAGAFYRNGYHVLFPDNRGHGKSQGDYVGMGWHDRLDILAWIDYLVKQDPECRIVLYGVSMGGAAVMMASGEALAENVRVIIEDCGYSSVKEELAYEAKYLFHLPYFPVVSAASLICRLRAGYSFSEASALKQLPKCRKPILFIHGGSDTFVPYAMLQKVYEAAPEPKAQLTVEGAGHAESALRDPQTYWNTVFDFIHRYR